MIEIKRTAKEEQNVSNYLCLEIYYTNEIKLFVVCHDYTGRRAVHLHVEVHVQVFTG